MEKQKNPQKKKTEVCLESRKPDQWNHWLSAGLVSLTNQMETTLWDILLPIKAKFSV